MDQHQSGVLLLKVMRVDRGRWDVFEHDVESPIASFNERQEACDYAGRIAAKRQGASVVMLDEELPRPAGRPADAVRNANSSK